jgi:hypothetical protein
LLELQAREGEIDEEELNRLAAERMKAIVKRILEEKTQKQVDKY